MKPSYLVLPLIFTFFLEGSLMWDYDSDESSEFDVSSTVSSADYISLENLNQEIMSIAQEILSEYPQWIEQFSKKVEEILIWQKSNQTLFTREEIIQTINQQKNNFIQRQLFFENHARATTKAQLITFTESITSASAVTIFRLHEYDKNKRNGVKKFSGTYRLVEAKIAKFFLRNAKKDPDGTVYIEDPHRLGVLVPEQKNTTYLRYLEKIKQYHQHSSVKKFLRTLACLRKSTPPSILINYIIPTDIIGLEDFIVTRRDALAIIEFLGFSATKAEIFLVTAQLSNPDLCVNNELELYNVHVLKTILEQTLTND